MMPLRLLRRTFHSGLAAALLLAMLGAIPGPALGQMHKVAKPEQVVRAVGVYEWTGDMAKPTASRLIPVSLFIDDHLEDAGVYLARPVPFALDTGTVYEIEQAGMPKGTLNLEFARHLVATGDAADNSTNYDDGWFGYGTFHGPPKPRPVVAKKAARPAITAKNKPAEESDRPTFAKRPGGGSASGTTSGTSTASTPDTGSDDPDRPHLTRKTGSGDSNGSSTQNTQGQTTPPTSTSPAGTHTSSTSDSTDDDPDRPKFAKRPSASPSTDSSANGGGTGAGQSTGGSSTQTTTQTTGNVPADDPDRPTLKKRTPAEAKEARKQSEQSNVQGATASLNDDPDRPRLERGKPAHPVTSAGFATLKGLPADLHQMVAVSDAKTREQHDFARPWEDDAERAAILSQMEATARAQVAAYDARQTAAIKAEVTASDAQAAQEASSKSAAAGDKAAASGNKAATTSRSNAARKKATAAKAAVPLVLQDEELKGYTLSYGGAATFVYSAHTAGSGAALRYVTVVAQKDALGALKPAIESVTDAARLDRTPRMRLVDVVDAEASNRASILFELRGENEREFALYRVIAARAEQTFLTGTTQ